MTPADDDLARFERLVAGIAEAPSAPDPRAARRRRRRRWAWIIVAVVIVLVLAAGGGYAGYALNAPVALPAAQTQAPQPVVGPKAALTMPQGTAAAIQVSGGKDFLGANGLSATSGSTDPLPMASISKLITTLVVLDAHPLSGPDDPGPTLTFSKADHALYDKYYVMDATIAPMPTGSTMSLRDALGLMLVISATNYADAVATWAFGSQSAFLRAADNWLARNGLTHTRLVEPTGIDPRDVSTTADLLKLGQLAMANPAVAALVQQPSAGVDGYTAPNTNGLLGQLGIRGIKTGTLDGANLLYSSQLDVGIGEWLDVTGVELGGTDHSVVDSDVTALLTSIRAGFHKVKVAAAGDVYGSYTTPWGAKAELVTSTDTSLLTWSDTPVTGKLTTTPLRTGKAGEKVGSITWTAGSRTATTPLVLSKTIPLPSDQWRLTHPFELGH